MGPTQATRSAREKCPGALGVRLLRAAAASAVLGLCVGGCAGAESGVDRVPSAATASSDGSDHGSTGTSSSTDEREVTPSLARRVGSIVPRRPREIRLPGTGWLPVAAVGTRRNGVLDVPDDVGRLGWWEGGSRVGDPFGAVLVAGHVDSETQGLGPSAVLLEVAAGDEVQVRTAGRTSPVTFRIGGRRLLPRADLPDYPRVYSPAGPPRLVLVTCAPPFLPDRGGYQNLAVVEASRLEPGNPP